eukprot:TRINITY_DN58057_c0_g1_i1.p1 TRINITY_DN58057_c0_g1~~TRINITY_DN58057_c0_g1_i1.p1  ORF type:complete len:993 (+),score=212.06 TRINITY_DN58057_c0_g1_i1:54-3032(+)
MSPVTRAMKRRKLAEEASAAAEQQRQLSRHSSAPATPPRRPTAVSRQLARHESDASSKALMKTPSKPGPAPRRSGAQSSAAEDNKVKLVPEKKPEATAPSHGDSDDDACSLKDAMERVIDDESDEEADAVMADLQRAPSVAGLELAPRGSKDDVPSQQSAELQLVPRPSFQPGPRLDEVCRERCMARVWGGGYGSQCRRRPAVGEFCGFHQGKPLSHGRVDGLVPEAKLREMMQVLGISGGSHSSSCSGGGDVSAEHVPKGRSAAASSTPVPEQRYSLRARPDAAISAVASCCLKGAIPQGAVSLRPVVGGSTCDDFNWTSDGEEEQNQLRPSRKRGRIGGTLPTQRRTYHSQAQLPEGGGAGFSGGSLRERVQVGDIVQAFRAQAASGRGGIVPLLGEVCLLFQDAAGKKLMLLRRMYTADDLRRRLAASSQHSCLDDAELVETEECLELPVASLAAILTVLSEEAFKDYLQDESVDLASLGNRRFFCRRQLAGSGVMWPTKWEDAGRADRREACLRAFRSAETKDSSPEIAKLVRFPEKKRQLSTLELAKEKFAMAAAALRPGAAGGLLPGREAEQEQVVTFLRDAIRAGGRKEVLYISGMPGTGKTASVLEAVESLRSARSSCSFEFVHINAMCLSSPAAVFAEICRKMPAATTGLRLRSSETGTSESQAQSALARFFTGGNARRQVVVLLIDEVDALVTQAQTVLYRLFDWVTRPGARMAVMAIANTMDLPERLLPRVASRLGVLRLNFTPYNRNQLRTILAERLRVGQAEGAFKEDALVLCAARVAAGSGDARKALQVCRRAVETQVAALVRDGKDPGPVTTAQMSAAEAALLRVNPAVRAVAGLGVKARRLLLAAVLELRRQPGSSAVTLHNLVHRYEVVLKIGKQREGEDDDSVAGSQQHLRCAEEVNFLLRRLQAMSILSPLTRCGAADTETKALGDRDASTLELGGSLDVDDVADALSSVQSDDLAQELLGFVAPPEPLPRAS